MAKGLDQIFTRLKRWIRADQKEVGRKAPPDVLGDILFWSLAREDFLAAADMSEAILTEAIGQAARLGLAVDFDLVNAGVLDLAAGYRNSWWDALEGTTREGMRQAIAAHIESGAARPELVKNLTPLFGRPRAGVIATTEITRLYAEGNRLAYASAGVEEVEWRTVVDPRVDDICRGLHKKRMPLGQEASVPPAHVRCRCWLAPVVDDRPLTEPRGAPAEQDENWLYGEIEDEKPLGGGISKTFTGQIGGRRVVIKTHDPVGDLESERAAVLINRAMGSPNRMPNLVLRKYQGRPAAVSEFVEGATQGYFHDKKPGRKERRWAAIFDDLIDNGDRHPGNYLFMEDGLWLIDHSLAFGKSGSGMRAFGRVVPSLNPGETRALEMLLANDELWGRQLPSLIGKARTNDAKKRVQSLLG